MGDAEIIIILILFHSGGFRCFKIIIRGMSVNITPKTNHFSAFLPAKKPADPYRRRAFMPADDALPDTLTKHCMAP